MPKTTTHQRKRRQQTLASMLYDPFIDGCFNPFHGDPAKAPKRWKRLWLRQRKFVLSVKPASRRLKKRGQPMKENRFFVISVDWGSGENVVPMRRAAAGM